MALDPHALDDPVIYSRPNGRYEIQPYYQTPSPLNIMVRPEMYQRLNGNAVQVETPLAQAAMDGYWQKNYRAKAMPPLESPVWPPVPYVHQAPFLQ